ncbi:MAG: hypothetical protein JSW43_02655 [Gemmatimonadota bacterium]|nr:MAG: hypothetical protein JSW43_02655 [Gemmatimonadota bacterium]
MRPPALSSTDAAPRRARADVPACRFTELPALPYTRGDWEAACWRAFGEGRAPAPCPVCHRTGFYAPRFQEPERRFRQCRFCGFTQEVGQLPERYRATVHNCVPWPRCARAAYVWWVKPRVASYRCPFCAERVMVSQALVPPPADDTKHPWQRVPQQKSRSYYEQFWARWSCSRGRAEL